MHDEEHDLDDGDGGCGPHSFHIELCILASIINQSRAQPLQHDIHMYTKNHELLLYNDLLVSETDVGEGAGSVLLVVLYLVLTRRRI